MHVVFLGMYPHKDVNTGGIGTFIESLAIALVKNGYHITVISSSGLKEESTHVINGVRVIRICSNNIKYLNGVYNIVKTNRLVRKIHKEHPIDIIEAAESGFAYTFFPSQIKKVIRLHGGHHFFTQLLSLPLNKKSAFLEKKSFKNADHFIAVTQFVLDGTRKYLPIPDSKATKIFYPVDCDKFYQASASKMVPFKIVFVGTVTEKKGIRQLVMALPAILKQFPNTVLDIYGPDWIMPDGSSFLEYLQTFITADLNDHIFFHGQVSNTILPPIYETAHLCAFPSHMETQGIVVLETMSMGKAVLFSTKGPGPETIDHLKDGLIVDPYSPEDIAEKIIHLFSHPGLELELGQNARRKMLEKYSLPVVTNLNKKFYEKLTQKT